LEFARYKSAEQRAELLALIGVDMDGFSRRRKTVFDERTEVNRSVKSLEGHLAGLTKHENLPPKQDVETLMAKLREAEERTSLRSRAEESTATRNARIEDCKKQIEQLKAEINSIENLNTKTADWMAANPAIDPEPIRVQITE